MELQTVFKNSMLDREQVYFMFFMKLLDNAKQHLTNREASSVNGYF
jgi:hypothetical protein